MLYRILTSGCQAATPQCMKHKPLGANQNPSCSIRFWPDSFLNTAPQTVQEIAFPQDFDKILCRSGAVGVRGSATLWTDPPGSNITNTFR